jgi:hypothetical protein
MGGIVVAAAIMTLADKLSKYIIEAVRETGEILDENRVKSEFNESLEDSRRAFEELLPRSPAIDPAILSEFFSSKVLELQCRNLLEGIEPDVNPLEEVFNEAYSARHSKRLPGFDARQAIAEFFERFIQSAGRKDSFVHVENFRLLRVTLLSDEDSDVRGSAAYALGSIGILDESVLGSLRGICEDYERYHDHVRDPESEGRSISICDWAFRTLWRHAPVR